MNYGTDFDGQEDNDCDKPFSRDVIQFQDQVENILAWLFRKEGELQNRPNESFLREANYNKILEEYSEHENFMTEFAEFCHVIMKCKEDGQDLHDNKSSLTDEDRDEITIQMDAMMVCYEKMKILTTDRLHFLQGIIEDRQQSKMERLEEWFSAIEKKLSNSNNIGPDCNAVVRQLKDLNDLRSELEQKQDFLNFISKVIIFDRVDPESLQMKTRSCDSLDEHLKNMNNRWTDICKCVDERGSKLKSAESIWKLLNLEGPQLNSWLSRVETSLNEVSEAVRNVTDTNTERPFIMKLVARSDKIDSDIKSKQSFYTRLENEVRLEIDKLEIDDSCSMLIIELEKKLEEMQDNWNSIMNRKRMLDYNLQALLNPEQREQVNTNMIPIPEPITSTSRNDIRFDSENVIIDPVSHRMNEFIDQMNNSSSSNNESSIQINGSLSDPRAFDNSLSSDNKSLVYSASRQDDLLYNNNNAASRDELSTNSMTTSYPTNMISIDDPTYSPIQTPVTMADDMLHLDHKQHINYDTGTSSCRVEEWKHSLESFSNWLKEVETSLGIEEDLDAPADTEAHRLSQAWSRLGLQQQLALLNQVEEQINSSCQDEFDCLLLQGQQIIEDLIPEIGEYESNLKEILADIEIRYATVKRYLTNRKHELANKDRWLDLLRNLRNSCLYLIEEMGQIVPESEIGVDLIVIAQQQDELMHAKANLEGNSIIQSNIEEAKLFLRVCDTLEQSQRKSQNTSSIINVKNSTHSSNINTDMMGNYSEIWLSFKDLREDIEDQLDRLTLHYSELSQLIDDRLSRLDDVHKEMHTIQQKMQELAPKLQVAQILRSNWVSLEGLSVENLSEQLEDLKLYRERLSEIETTHRILNSIFDSMKQSNVPLSQQNLDRIEELNNFWSQIQESVDERQKEIEQAFDSQGASEQKFLNQTLADLPNWERRVAPTKIPYFIDHETNKTIWDHPKFSALLTSLTSVKKYVFSAYRTALKLKTIQRHFGIDRLMMEQLRETFDETEFKLKQQLLEVQGPSSSDNKSLFPISGANEANTLIGVEHMIIHLKAIYDRIQAESKPDLDVPLSIDLTLNWLLNLYDSTRTGYISNLSFKVGLSLLSCATREEKYTYMYELIANRTTNSVDARKLGTLAETCIRIPIYLGEGESFGGPELIETSIRECFAMSKFNPDHPNCIDLEDFLNWLKTEPQFIIWLPVLHRLLISEKNKHAVRCKLCRTKPITGLRYRCLKCLKFHICQECFLTARHIFEHQDPNQHQMQEYCSKTSSGENVRDFTKILLNKITPKSRSNS